MIDRTRPAGSRASIAGRNLYLCTADRPDLAQFLDGCIRGGVDIVQLRDKELEPRQIVQRADVARRVCADHGVPFLLNDRPDLALEVGADGVHVGQDDASPTLARRILGPDVIVGFSTHAVAELDASVTEPVSYVSAGPVEATPTKQGRPGTGPEYVAYAVERAGRPVFITGGVTPETIPGLAAVGARCFVVVRYLTESHDPRSSAQALRRAIDSAVEDEE